MSPEPEVEKELPPRATTFVPIVILVFGCGVGPSKEVVRHPPLDTRPNIVECPLEDLLKYIFRIRIRESSRQEREDLIDVAIEEFRGCFSFSASDSRH